MKDELRNFEFAHWDPSVRSQTAATRPVGPTNLAATTTPDVQQPYTLLDSLEVQSVRVVLHNQMLKEKIRESWERDGPPLQVLKTLDSALPLTDAVMLLQLIDEVYLVTAWREMLQVLKETGVARVRDMLQAQRLSWKDEVYWRHYPVFRQRSTVYVRLKQASNDTYVVDKHGCLVVGTLLYWIQKEHDGDAYIFMLSTNRSTYPDRVHYERTDGDEIEKLRQQVRVAEARAGAAGERAGAVGPERSIEACKQRFKKLQSRSLTQSGGRSQQGIPVETSSPSIGAEASHSSKSSNLSDATSITGEGPSSLGPGQASDRTFHADNAAPTTEVTHPPRVHATEKVDLTPQPGFQVGQDDCSAVDLPDTTLGDVEQQSYSADCVDGLGSDEKSTILGPEHHSPPADFVAAPSKCRHCSQPASDPGSEQCHVHSSGIALCPASSSTGDLGPRPCCAPDPATAH